MPVLCARGQEERFAELLIMKEAKKALKPDAVLAYINTLTKEHAELQGVFETNLTEMRAVAPVRVPNIASPLAAYSHGIEVVAGSRLLFCSGQLALGVDGLVPAECEAQSELCFRNIGEILASADMSFDDVVRINAFVTAREHMAPYMKVRDSLFSSKPDDNSSILRSRGMSFRIVLGPGKKGLCARGRRIGLYSGRSIVADDPQKLPVQAKAVAQRFLHYRTLVHSLPVFA